MATAANIHLPKTETGDAGDAELRLIPVDRVEPNPDNPRLIFRQGELEQLLESIRIYGVQVPISVYREGNKYVLIDGQRRWLCSMKLNKKEVPALVQEKPSELTNLLLMFNIHSLREQWDLLTVAMKLPKVIALLTDALGSEPNEGQLAEYTGLSRAKIRRSKLLLALPQEYRDMMMAELRKPKAQQRLSEDFFVEMERALTTVERRMPDLVKSKDRVRRVLIDKYLRGTIPNLVQLRTIAKIARADLVEANPQRAHDVLNTLFSKNDYSAERAYNDSVSDAYLERDVTTRIRALIDKLRYLEPEDVDDELRNELIELISQAERLLESRG